MRIHDDPMNIFSLHLAFCTSKLDLSSFESRTFFSID